MNETEARLSKAYEDAFDQLDRALELPNALVNQVIDWTYQNQGRFPEQRKTQELMLRITPDDILLIEAAVRHHFGSLLERNAELAKEKAPGVARGQIGGALEMSQVHAYVATGSPSTLRFRAASPLFSSSHARSRFGPSLRRVLSYPGL